MIPQQPYTTTHYATLFQQGGEEGLQFFYLELHSALSHYANRWVNDRTIAEDIASEAFLRTWKFHPKLESYAAIKAYLYKATGRLSQRYAGKEKKRLWIQQEVFSAMAAPADPFDNLVRTETYAKLRSALAKLAPGMQQVLRLHFLEGKKLTEIAAELHVSPKTVHAQKVQGLKALRKVLVRTMVILVFVIGFFMSL